MLQDLLIEIAKEFLVAVLMALGLAVPFALPDSSVAAPSITERTTSSAAIASTTLYAVVKVVDGDTVHVDIQGKKETVRLIGINTPETVDPRRPVQCFGKEASDKAKELLAGRNVRVVADKSQDVRDKYGRLLAYIYRDDGLFINKYMIQEGYAYEYTYRVPYQFQADFKQAQKMAEANKKGLWADGVCQQI